MRKYRLIQGLLKAGAKVGNSLVDIDVLQFFVLLPLMKKRLLLFFMLILQVPLFGQPLTRDNYLFKYSGPIYLEFLKEC